MKVKLYVNWFINMSVITPPYLSVHNFNSTVRSAYEMPAGVFEVDLPIEQPTLEEQQQYANTFKEQRRREEIDRLTKHLASLTKTDDGKIPDAYEQTHPAYPKEDLG